MGDLAGDGASDELANRGVVIPALLSLLVLTLPLVDWMRRLKIPESAGGRKDTEMVLGIFSTILSR